MPVVAVQAQRQPVVESVSLVGTLAANEEIELKTETDGIVEEILFEEGNLVTKGQLLLRLDETKLQAELADAEARLKLYGATYARSRQLYGDQLISQQEYDQAASAFEVGQATVELRRRQLRDARVSAPFEGFTGARNVSPGQVITRNTPITWLVDLDPVKVEMNMPERFLSQTKLGQTVHFEVTAYPGEKFQGEIYFIAPRLDLTTRTALVKTRIPNPQARLKPGMVANLELSLTIRDSAVVIPEAALINDGDQTSVFLVDSNGTARLQPVQTGQRLPRRIEITQGLQGNEMVIVEGHQKISPGMPVSLAPPEKAAIYHTEDL
jgi:membrane fusion protein (multidrug efflux system)